jgi:hypothetical protein
MTRGYRPISSKGFYKKSEKETRVDMYVTYHGMFNAEVDAFLVWVDPNLNRIVDAPGMRQGWG